ncbi:MAG: RDD family protein [Mycobacterium sp.]
MSRTISSWLSGPESEKPDRSAGYPGEELGLPARGPGSPAPMGRRFLALAVDWLVAYGLAGLGLTLGMVTREHLPTAVLVVWLLLGVIAVRLFGFTSGQFAARLRVVPVGTADRRVPDGAGVGVGRAVLRGLLIALVIPALFIDADGRGLQDRASGTAVVRR